MSIPDSSSGKPSSSSDRAYAAVREAVIAWHLPPGSRINEVALARELGASRTPLREALNRLVAEGFLTFEQDRGFFCRTLDPRNIYELYQLRALLEVAAARLACEQATATELQALSEFLAVTGPDPGGRADEELVELDEHFHTQMMALARNEEMGKVLANVNAKIRFFRWIDMASRRSRTQGEHRAIVTAMMERDAAQAADLMQKHIERRMDEISEAVKIGRSRLDSAHQES